MCVTCISPPSHCSPPLTQFFLECGGMVRTDKKPALCKSYQKLVSDLWQKNRCVTAVVVAVVCESFFMTQQSLLATLLSHIYSTTPERLYPHFAFKVQHLPPNS